MKFEKSEVSEDYLGMIEQCVSKLDGTLQDILAYSYNARSHVVGEKIDLKKFFFDNFEKQVPPGMVFELSYNQTGDKEILADPYRLNLIISSLVANAIKYSDPLKKTKTISLSVKSEENLTLELSDNGLGINDNVLPKIFDMFYRGNEKSNGSGLGLYIAKEAVEKLGGSINVRTVAGEGTTFTITIPINH
jgi:signal transduction histidine kinase